MRNKGDESDVRLICHFEHRLAAGFATKGGWRNLSDNNTIVCEGAGAKSHRGEARQTSHGEAVRGDRRTHINYVFKISIFISFR
ncbi:MAG: hypothetical protein IPG24_05465 [Leptospiraceae bacterium]|nr:hypothetical protein [Leptospiraceae bacterium]